MNSVINSDSEQCPESKLGQVQVCTPMDTGCAHAARALRPGQPCCTMSWGANAPYRGRAPVVSQPVAGRVVAVS